MKSCPKCGATFGVASAFCPMDGKEVTSEACPVDGAPFTEAGEANGPAPGESGRGAAVAFFSRGPEPAPPEPVQSKKTQFVQAGVPPPMAPVESVPTLAKGKTQFAGSAPPPPAASGHDTSKIGSSSLFTPASLPPVATAAAAALPVEQAAVQPASQPDLESVTAPAPVVAEAAAQPQEEPDDADDPAIKAEADQMVGQVLGERYRVDEMIGVGGMGIVFKATHVAIGKPMAIKVLRHRHAQKENVSKRFAQEAQLASKIKHPNIVDIVDYGINDFGCPYYVMEHLQGGSLAWEVDNKGRLAPDRAIDIAVQICSGLSEAHTQGVIHRDLKPDNVFLCRSGDEGRDLVKLLDFGIARVSGRKTRLTAAGAVVGTPEYMSPEQAQGKEVDPRSDLYSVGVMLFEMLTAQVPFRADTMVGTLTKQVFEAPPPLRQFEPNLPQLPNIERLLSQLLAKNMDERPNRAADVIKALKEAGAGDLTEGGAVAKPQQRATVSIGSWGVGDKAPVAAAGSVDAYGGPGPQMSPPQNAGWAGSDYQPPKRPSVIIRDGTPAEFVPASARRSRGGMGRRVAPIVVLGSGAAVFAALLTVGLVRYADRKDPAPTAAPTPTETLPAAATEVLPTPAAPEQPQSGNGEAAEAAPSLAQPVPTPVPEVGDQTPAPAVSPKKSKSKKRVAEASNKKSRRKSGEPPVQRPSASKSAEKPTKPRDPPPPPSVSLGDLKDPFAEK